jgi:hypothetical protein
MADRKALKDLMEGAGMFCYFYDIERDFTEISRRTLARDYIATLSRLDKEDFSNSALESARAAPGVSENILNPGYIELVQDYLIDNVFEYIAKDMNDLMATNQVSYKEANEG